MIIHGGQCCHAIGTGLDRILRAKQALNVSVIIGQEDARREAFFFVRACVGNRGVNVACDEIKKCVIGGV